MSSRSSLGAAVFSVNGPDLNDGWTYNDQVVGADCGKPVLEFYASKYTHSSVTTWRERLLRGLILLDGEVATADAELRAGQQLSYVRPPWREPKVPDGIEILHEDEDLIAVAKPSGLPVLPGGDFLQNTLLTMIAARYPAASPIHRLGRGTSGLVLFARTDKARRTLSAALRDRQLGKTYRALVRGTGMADTFTIDQSIGPIPYPHLPYVHAADDRGVESLSECLVVHRDYGPDRRGQNSHRPTTPDTDSPGCGRSPSGRRSAVWQGRNPLAGGDRQRGFAR